MGETASPKENETTEEVVFASYQLEDGSFSTPSELNMDSVGFTLLCPYCRSNNTGYSCLYSNWVCNSCDVVFSLEDTGYKVAEVALWERFRTKHGELEISFRGS